MGELEGEYEGRVRFEIVSAEETAARADELVKYELGSHGLVVFDPEGVPQAHIAGHEFGREEIIAAIEAVLR